MAFEFRSKTLSNKTQTLVEVENSEVFGIFDPAITEVPRTDYYLPGNSPSEIIVEEQKATEYINGMKKISPEVRSIDTDGASRGVIKVDVEDATILPEKAVVKGAKYAVEDIAAIGFTVVTAAIAVVAAIWSVIKTAHEDNNDVVTTSIGAITEAEANAWNAANASDKSKQVIANGEFTLDTEHSNTVSSGGILKFAPGSDADSQIALRINIAALSTQYIPLSSSGDDPYRKGMYDAALQLSFADGASVSSVDDQLFDMKRQAAQDMGYAAFAQDLRLAAPDVELNAVVHSGNSNGILYHGNGKLLGKRTKAIPDILGDSLILNENEDISLNIKVPGNGTSTQGNGLGVNFVGEDSSSGAVRFLPVKSMGYRQQIDSLKDYAVPYLYSKFGCSLPENLDENCSLTLHMGGYNDGKRHTGKLYLADSGSHTAGIPVYINWRLITNQSEFPTITEYDSTPQLLVVANAGSEDYEHITLSGNLPPEAHVTGCEDGLKAGQQCTLTFDLSGVLAGNYSAIVNGVKAGGDATAIAEADQSPLNINIAGGW